MYSLQRRALERVKWHPSPSSRLSIAHGEKFFRKEFSRKPSGMRVSIMEDTHRSQTRFLNSLSSLKMTRCMRVGQNDGILLKTLGISLFFFYSPLTLTEIFSKNLEIRGIYVYSYRPDTRLLPWRLAWKIFPETFLSEASSNTSPNLRKYWGKPTAESSGVLSFGYFALHE